jgi:hypothetical protein
MTRGSETLSNGEPLHERYFLWRMQREAASTAQYMAESWTRRPTRPNKKIERLALWHTIYLDASCRRAFKGRTQIDAPLRTPPLQLSESHADAQTRYDIQAAARMVPELVSFRDDREEFYRGSLGNIGSSFDAWCKAVAEHKPRIVGEWHRWLWSTRHISDPADIPAGPGDHGESSLLAIAAERIASGLELVLESPDVVDAVRQPA